MRNKKIISILISCIIVFSSVFLIIIIFNSESESHDYYNALEEWWQPIGASPNIEGESDHSFQSMVIGDLFANGSLVALSHYHHGQCGVFLNTKVNGAWEKDYLLPKFVRGTEQAGGWAVKGLFGEDIDGDGFKEIITGADVVAYPTINETLRPFPAAIYLDLNNNADHLIPQPLVWGKWGQKIANESFASLVPKIISPKFRNGTNFLKDIMIQTSTYVNNTWCSRLFVLEQPNDGFGGYNYTFETSTLQGSEPYENEAFYVKHLYTNKSGLIEEMLFKPDAWNATNPADSATINGFTITDFNHDDLQDIAVSVEYWLDGVTCGSEIFLFKRKMSPNPNYTYCFEEVDKIRSYGKTYSHITTANLDGNDLNGDEAFVTTSLAAIGGEHASIVNYITIENETLLFQTLDIDVTSSSYPYMGSYANVLVLDGNNDGYDDVIVYGVNKKSSFEKFWGDIIYFENKGDQMGQKYFIYDDNHTKVLMKGQSSSWSLTMQNCDEDIELELVVCVQNKLPYWHETEDSEAHVYYCDIYSVLNAYL